MRCIEAATGVCRAQGLSDPQSVVKIAETLYAFVEPLDKPKTLTLPKKDSDRK
jgi:hypothetical protein